LHNLRQYGETTCVVSAKRGVTPSVLGFFKSLGVEHVIVAETLGMHPHSFNAFVMEMSLTLSTEALRQGIDTLANHPNPPQATADQFSWFRLVANLSVDHADPETIPDEVQQIAHQDNPHTIGCVNK
jgi:hypothetical protein